MAITNLERKEIKKEAKFLENFGYTRAENECSINYILDDICICIVYPPNSEESHVNIRFIVENKVFSVDWIAFVRGDINGSNDKLKNVIELLQYVKNQYSQITDYQFCMESNSLIDKYVEINHKKFDNAIRDFLSKQ